MIVVQALNLNFLLTEVGAPSTEPTGLEIKVLNVPQRTTLGEVESPQRCTRLWIPLLYSRIHSRSVQVRGGDQPWTKATILDGPQNR